MKVKLGFFEILTILLFVLKAFEIIVIDWPFVFLPLVVPYVVVPFCIGITVLFGLAMLLTIACGSLILAIPLALVKIFDKIQDWRNRKYYKK